MRVPLFIYGNAYGWTASVCDLLHVQVAAATDERVHVGAGTPSWHVARQLCRGLLADVGFRRADAESTSARPQVPCKA